jgi:hypothetical protein
MLSGQVGTKTTSTASDISSTFSAGLASASAGTAVAATLCNTVAAAVGNETQLTFSPAGNYSATGAVGVVIESTATANSALKFYTYNAGLLEAARIDSGGNYIPKNAAKGINFTANTPLAGMTSQLLNWYEQGTYTPSFLAETGTAPSLGNGTLTGAYTRIGRLVQAQIKLLLGSTTTMGSGGVLQFGIPFTASSVYGATGTAYIDDTGTGWTIGFPTLRSSTILDISLAAPGVIGTARMTSTAPMVWTTGDSLVISFVYFV